MTDEVTAPKFNARILKLRRAALMKHHPEIKLTIFLYFTILHNTVVLYIIAMFSVTKCKISESVRITQSLIKF